MAVVSNRRWPRSAPRPNIGERALLADARFVGEPNLQRLVCGSGRNRFGYKGGEVFLKAS
jgi:hypothetical protein